MKGMKRMKNVKRMAVRLKSDARPNRNAFLHDLHSLHDLHA
jgi:hypothetical protein